LTDPSRLSWDGFFIFVDLLCGMDISNLYKIYLQHPSVQTDTRKLKAGDIFFALKGPNFNGNAFARQSLEDGADWAVIDEKEFEIPGKTILVENVLVALQQLAAHHRRHFDSLTSGKQVPFIAITGSNGKTTTKELIHTVLSSTFKTYTTEGNLNNHIGVPLTILKIKDDAEMVVIEMGANHIGEIASYCLIANPTHGIITNCGKAHLEGFGSEEGVRKAKGELFDHLRTRTHGFAFVMWDYEYLQEMSKGISGIIKYGTRNAHVTGSVINSDPFLEIKITQGLDNGNLKTRLVGEYNFPNVLAAVTIGKYFNVPEDKIRLTIANYTPSNSRSQLIEKDTNKIILDAYNANPSSMKSAIENFAKIQSNSKVMILGSMAELGKQSKEEHFLIAELIKKYKWKDVVLVGQDFKKTEHPFQQFENAEEAKKWLKQQHFQNTHFLIKGSRSMQMEKVLEAL
jgi:UDP-N-acetylmuramoyl-tripeptide--D-alanyl-D-alanine ligase